jgi:hypothetical protein
MAEIEIGPLTDRLSDDEIAELAKQMERLGAPALPRTDESGAMMVSDEIDDDVLEEFLDHLEGHDVAADIYLPIEFEGMVEVARLRVASAQQLIDVLDEVREELSLGEEEDEEDDEASEFDEERRETMRYIWRVFLDGATAALDRKLPLLVKG